METIIIEVKKLKTGDVIVGTLATFTVSEVKKTIDREMVNVYNSEGEHILYHVNQEIEIAA